MTGAATAPRLDSERDESSHFSSRAVEAAEKESTPALRDGDGKGPFRKSASDRESSSSAATAAAGGGEGERGRARALGEGGTEKPLGLARGAGAAGRREAPFSCSALSSSGPRLLLPVAKEKLPASRNREVDGLDVGDKSGACRIDSRGAAVGDGTALHSTVARLDVGDSSVDAADLHERRGAGAAKLPVGPRSRALGEGRGAAREVGEGRGAARKGRLLGDDMGIEPTTAPPACASPLIALLRLRARLKLASEDASACDGTSNEKRLRD